MVIEKFNRSESAQKIHASRGSCQVHAHRFWWVWFLRFGGMATFQKRPNFPFGAWNRLKEFMQVGVDVNCMHTDFGECGFFGFGDMATF